MICNECGRANAEIVKIKKRARPYCAKMTVQCECGHKETWYALPEPSFKVLLYDYSGLKLQNWEWLQHLQDPEKCTSEECAGNAVEKLVNAMTGG